MNEQKLRNKLKIMIVTVILLSLGLVGTSVALASSIAKIRTNHFTMSMGVELELNEGKPVVDMSGVVFEPGGTYISEFPISNLSSFDVWYRVYFTDVKGKLKDEVHVKVTEEDGTILCDGMIAELDSGKVIVSSLLAGEEKILKIEFTFSKTADNTNQGETVMFNVTADATQKQNNPHMDFGD